MNNLYNFNAAEIDRWIALSRKSVLVSRMIEGGANASQIAEALVVTNDSLLKRVIELEGQRGMVLMSDGRVMDYIPPKNNLPE